MIQYLRKMAIVAMMTAVGCAVSGPSRSKDNDDDGVGAQAGSTAQTGAGGLSSGSGSGEGGAGASGQGGDEQPAPSYPEGPYGNQIGDVIENLSFVDRNGNAVSLEQFYGGTERALVLFGTEAWCGACATASYQLAADLQASTPGKAAILGVLFADGQGNPPTASTADAYMQSKSDAFEFVADPPQVMNQVLPGNGIPRLMVIDTADMTIVFTTIGHNEDEVVNAVGALQ